MTFHIKNFIYFNKSSYGVLGFWLVNGLLCKICFSLDRGAQFALRLIILRCVLTKNDIPTNQPTGPPVG